ncbi:MAG: AEC family transporter [Elusimicrobia bacterium]|nr:AEC family transporter [Elusimicrobiota bacterium]
MIPLIISLFSKVFVFVLAGILIARFSGSKAEFYAEKLISFILYILVPLFIIDTIWTNSISFFSAWKVAATAIFVIISGAFLSYILAKVKKASFPRYALSIAFMNSAFLAIPIASLLWGKTGAQYAIIYNIILTVSLFTLGVWWISGKSSLIEMFKLPEIYSIIIGFILYFLKIKPLPEISKALQFISSITLAFMLIFVGYRIAKIKFHIVWDSIIGVMLRIFGGWISALIAVYFLAIPYPEAGICIMSSVMPTAIMSYILAEKFKSDSEFVATTIVLGTIISIFTIPLVGYLYGRH